MKTKMITTAIIFFFASIASYAHSFGIVGVTLKSSAPGCTCHSPTPTPTVNVTISGPDTLTLGQIGLYTVTITGGPLAAAGTNIAASTGSLSVVTGEGLQLLSGELTHTNPKTPVSGSVSFQFNYQAPAAEGPVTLYANGNSVNLNGNNQGDQWNFAPNKTITVMSPTASTDQEAMVNTYKLNQNYPNPFNPSTTISFSVAQSTDISLAVYNEIGKEVAILFRGRKEKGDYSYNFQAAGLPSGIYFYKLITGNFTQTKKMLLLK